MHLRGHGNIIKRLLIHACSLNLGFLMRTLYGTGTPRRLQDGGFHAVFALLRILASYLTTDSGPTKTMEAIFAQNQTPIYLPAPVCILLSNPELLTSTPVC